MELQLGLSLVPPCSSNNNNNNNNNSNNNSNNSSSSSSSIEGFDLNHFVYEAKSSIVIGSPSHNILLVSDHCPNHNAVGHFVSNNNNNKKKIKKKRMFCQAFLENVDNNNTIDHHQVVPKTLPLLWNNINGDGGGDDDEKNPGFSLIENTNDDEEDGVVGWPPIRSWRKRLCCDIAAGRSSEIGNRTVENGCSCGGRVSKFMYVKVKMEGVAIARKVDLSAHSCFETLMNTLMNMFGKYHEDSENFKLTYQDREGDWLLAQDVSWRTFIRSVQRLKLVRRNH